MLALLLATAAAPFAIASAHAEIFPGSTVQVGPWRVQAHTRGRSPSFESCTLMRTQSEGFSVFMHLRTGGSRDLAAEAPAWGLTPGEYYPASLTVGSNAFTFNGIAVNARVLSFNTAPEFFTALRSGLQLGLSANQRHFNISLDGIEAATARQEQCVKEYAGRTLPPSPAATPTTQARSPTVPLNSLAVLVHPNPVYPQSSRLAGEQGEVVIDATVDADGLPSVIALQRSSGYPALDNAAIEAVKGARFKPYMVNGKPQPIVLRMPISFRLQ